MNPNRRTATWKLVVLGVVGGIALALGIDATGGQADEATAWA
jgi:hypothetical protein